MYHPCIMVKDPIRDVPVLAIAIGSMHECAIVKIMKKPQKKKNVPRVGSISPSGKKLRANPYIKAPIDHPHDIPTIKARKRRNLLEMYPAIAPIMIAIIQVVHGECSPSLSSNARKMSNFATKKPNKIEAASGNMLLPLKARRVPIQI